ncbi:hypothetical protein [Nostoc sp. CHAB 5715]|uniref:hypothetical protein n=1 Tax=Nostoc sp. CHAB 5715 TaxID=2780400 RepID=UPI001E3E9A31|nr:hypothetical protein [Nostoc sp. CHAB 5715]MCC5622054.1 hypothetical protein [Nostoc sp. CHAB 5715]
MPFNAEFTTKALQEGKLLILLDGLDEVPTVNTDRTYAQVTENKIEPQRSQCALAVPRLEATGATQRARRNKSFREFLRKS